MFWLTDSPCHLTESNQGDPGHPAHTDSAATDRVLSTGQRHQPRIWKSQPLHTHAVCDHYGWASVGVCVCVCVACSVWPLRVSKCWCVCMCVWQVGTGILVLVSIFTYFSLDNTLDASPKDVRVKCPAVEWGICCVSSRRLPCVAHLARWGWSSYVDRTFLHLPQKEKKGSISFYKTQQHIGKCTQPQIICPIYLGRCNRGISWKK